MKKLLILIVLGLPWWAHAWGRRGHSLIGETAAQVVAKSTSTEFLRNHSYDLGYYCNVPDFFWKKPETFEAEHPNHFMDMEIFERAFAKQPDVHAPFELSRADFEKQFPEVGPSAGRAFWRIREMTDQLADLSASLRKFEGATKDAKGPNQEKRKLQEQWLLLAGVLGHYVGDLGMPLHVSENYDGQMTGQKGIHSYFEDESVDAIYPSLVAPVYADTLKQWPAFTRKNAKKSVLEMIENLARDSRRSVTPLLKLDKSQGRKNTGRSAEGFRALIRRRMVASTLVLAEIYRRNSAGWTFDDHRFFFFNGEPEFMRPPGTAQAKPQSAVE